MKKAVRSPGVLGDVSADGTGALARWIGSKSQSVSRCGLIQIEIDHARFDHCGALQGIDLDDLSHPVHIENPGTVHRNRTATESRSRTSRHEGDARSCKYANRVDDFCLVLQQQYTWSLTAMQSQAITVIQPTFIFIGEDARSRNDCSQLIDQ